MPSAEQDGKFITIPLPFGSRVVMNFPLAKGYFIPLEPLIKNARSTLYAKTGIAFVLFVVRSKETKNFPSSAIDGTKKDTKK